MIKIDRDYLNWLVEKVFDETTSAFTYDSLFTMLFEKEFVYSLDRDGNRASDGIELRRRYFLETGNCYLEDERPCSILEMMIGLAIRCEEEIMMDPRYDDRTYLWFWDMISSLGLNDFSDDHFYKEEAEEIIRRFIFREYEPNGRGGLFYIRNCDRDVRDQEIWVQMCWYINSISL